jgi:hypothetical protein
MPLRPRPWAIAMLCCLAALLVSIIANVVWIDSYAKGISNDVPQFSNSAQDRSNGQATFYAIDWMVGVGALATTAVWVVARLQTARAPVQEGGEGLVHLVTRAEGYLRGLRGLLWVAGGYILLFGFILVPFTDELTISYQDHSVAGWSGWIGLFVGIFWLVSFVAWLTYVVAVTRELRRWRRQGDDPLGLTA